MKTKILCLFLLLATCLSAQKVEFEQLILIDSLYYFVNTEDVSDDEGLNKFTAISRAFANVNRDYERAARKEAEADNLKRRARLGIQSLEGLIDTSYNDYLAEIDSLITTHGFTNTFEDDLRWSGNIYPCEVFQNNGGNLVARIQTDSATSETISVRAVGGLNFIRLGTTVSPLSIYGSPIFLYKDFYLSRKALRYDIYRGEDKDGRIITFRIRTE